MLIAFRVNKKYKFIDIYGYGYKIIKWIQNGKKFSEVALLNILVQ